MRLARVLVIVLIFFNTALFARTYKVESPDRKITVSVNVNDEITWSVEKDGQVLLEPSKISMTINGKAIAENFRFRNIQKRSKNEVINPVVAEKRKSVKNNYNELLIKSKDRTGIVFRAFDDGVAYRFFTTYKRNLTVNEEVAQFKFPGSPNVVMAFEEDMFSSQEKLYLPAKLADVKDRFAYCPVIIKLESGTNLVLTEVHLEDYAGMFVQGDVNAPNVLTGVFPRVAKSEEQGGDRPERHLFVTERYDYIAKTKGARQFPWRLLAIAETDAEIVESDIVYRLAPECRLKDTSWIKPGKVAWDWWNANNVFGVDFEAGINIDTYKYYIDFAAEQGIEYVILDEGWSNPSDLFDLNPEMDIKILIDYAAEKNVGIIPWVVWLTLENQMDEALAMFEEIGAKGIKVDFMDRDDQKIVNWYWEVAEKCAKHHLLVDFHGAYKPTGIRRAYPNVITREAIKGLEYTKWSDEVTPEHNVTIPFTRMFAGPMDYTPGATQNTQKENFNSVFARPVSQGTRCHQIAMFVVYESPLQMMADSPSMYKKEPDMMAFLSPVPSVWDETKVLDGKIGDYIIVARQSGDEWWVGAMTDWDERELEISLDFLGEGNYSADIFMDGVNANNYASDYKRIQKDVNKGEKLTLKLAKGGGWAARFIPEK